MDYLIRNPWNASTNRQSYDSDDSSSQQGLLPLSGNSNTNYERRLSIISSTPSSPIRTLNSPLAYPSNIINRNTRSHNKRHRKSRKRVAALRRAAEGSSPDSPAWNQPDLAEQHLNEAERLPEGMHGIHSATGDDEALHIQNWPVLPYDDFSTIDWMRDWMRNHRRQRRVFANKQTGWQGFLDKAFEATQSWILVSVIGISIGLLASSIGIVAAWMADMKQGVCSTEWYLSKDLCCKGLIRSGGYCDDFKPWSSSLLDTTYNIALIDFILYVIISVGLSSACVVIVVQTAKYAAGSGVSEIKTILGGFVIKRFLGLRTLIVKSLVLPMTIASGLAIGKEGPIVHLACCIGNTFPRLFPKYKNNEARKREILSASAAAGVAVAFGAPIGGVLFSLEELSSFFPSKTMLRSFVCALVSCVTLQFIDPYQGKRVLFQITYSRNWYFFEIVFFVVIGVMGGLLGAFFISANIRVQAIRKKFDWIHLHPVYEIAIIALCTSAIGYMNMFLRIDNSELLEYLFKECDSDPDNLGLCGNTPSQLILVLISLIIALIVKTLCTIITFGTKVPSGIFIPSMVWGALFGRILGIAVQQIQSSNSKSTFFSACTPHEQCVTPGMYSLLGAMAGLGGVTKLTVSLTVIMFELTGTLNYIIPCMITVIVAKFVGDLFYHGGVAEVLIRMNNLPFLDPRDDPILGISASEAMTPVDDLICLTTKDMTLADVEAILKDFDFRGFPIIESYENPSLIGYIARQDLSFAIRRAADTIRLYPEIKLLFDDTLQQETFDSSRTRETNISSFEVPNRSFVAFESNNHVRDEVQGVDVSDSTLREFTSVNLVNYVDHPPLGVDPRVPIELVIDLFKKLGPRVVIVKQNGKLCGIITKKDLLTLIVENSSCSYGIPHD